MRIQRHIHYPGALICYALLLLASSVAGAVSANHVATDNPLVELPLLGETYHLEIVDTPGRRAIGLMHREALEADHGMLFLYRQTRDHRIWMKNTLIPLTVIWLDDEARILKLAILSPCGNNSCPSFGAGERTRFILELHPDAASRFKPGDRLPALLNYLAPG